MPFEANARLAIHVLPRRGAAMSWSRRGSIEGSPTSDATQIGGWLWREGGGGLNQPTAWGTNFGSFTAQPGNNLALSTFSGIGTLGGGNVTIAAGGNIGDVLQGIVAAVGGSGQFINGSLVQTGGGTLTVTAGGNIGAGNSANGVTGGQPVCPTCVATSLYFTDNLAPSLATISDSPIVFPVRAEEAQSAHALWCNDHARWLFRRPATVWSISTPAAICMGGIEDPGRVALEHIPPAPVEAALGSDRSLRFVDRSDRGSTCSDRRKARSRRAGYLAGARKYPIEPCHSLHL